MNESFNELTLSEIKRIVQQAGTVQHIQPTVIPLDEAKRILPCYLHWEDDGHTATVTVKGRTPNDIDTISLTIREQINNSKFTMTEMPHDYNQENNRFIKVFKIRDIAAQ